MTNWYSPHRSCSLSSSGLSDNHANVEKDKFYEMAKAGTSPRSKRSFVVPKPPVSDHDVQAFLQSLAECRNLCVACATGERRDTELHKKCETLVLAIDAVVIELIGDASYLDLSAGSPRARG